MTSTSEFETELSVTVTSQCVSLDIPVTSTNKTVCS